MTLKQWQGIGHLIDEPLKNRAMQSLERLKDGAGDADLERRSDGAGDADLERRIDAQR